MLKDATLVSYHVASNLNGNADAKTTTMHDKLSEKTDTYAKYVLTPNYVVDEK